MAVARMDRLGLTVRSLDRMARFYQEAFDCRIIAEAEDDAASFGLEDARLQRLSVTLGRQIIELACFDPPGAPWPGNPRSNDFTFQHFAIAVSDMAKAYLHLLTIPGWTPISTGGPVQLPQSSGGVTAFKFRDPEGHPLELLEFPKKLEGKPLFYEIDHSAIVVKDTERSLAFYAEALGLSPGKRSLNQGAEQVRLDDLNAVKVRVTPLVPAGRAVPHVELLCYEHPSDGSAPSNNKTSADAIATRMVFACDDVEETTSRAIAAGAALIVHHGDTFLLRDPDGHDLILQPLTLHD